MTRLSITIALGNDSMETAADVVDALTQSLIRQAASPIDPLTVGERGIVWDANGNRVGAWAVE